MAARSQHARTSSNNVRKVVNGRAITLWCQADHKAGFVNSYPKSRLYNLFKKIEKGTLVLPEGKAFNVESDGIIVKLF